MLTILQGGLHADTEGAVFKQLARCVRQKHAAVLIVPEQQTLSVEKEAALRLPADAPLYFEATNFSRLANRVFRTTGGLAGEYSEKTAKALLMWQTLTELSVVLSPGFSHVCEGTVNKALAALSQLRRFGLSAAQATQAAEVTHQHRLKEKLTDIGRIGALFQQLHNARFADTAEDIGKMCGRLEAAPALFSDVECFVLGFTSFTEDQLAALCRLCTRTHVTVALPLPKYGEERFEYAEPRAAKRRLISLAGRHGFSCTVKKLDGNGRDVSPILYETLPLLFAQNCKIDKDCLQNKENLRIFRGADPMEAADFLAADILRRATEEGARFSDFAIVCAHAESYEGILDVALEGARIPAFFSLPKDITSFEATKLIYAAYGAVLGGFGREDVMLYAKCAPEGTDKEALDAFELYTERWNIDGERFTDGVTWNMNPAGYTDRVGPEAAATLLCIHQTRERLIGPLMSFSEDIQAAGTVKGQAEALVHFLETVGLESKLRERAEALFALGERRAAEGNGGLYGVLCSIIDRMVEVCGNFAADGRTFLSLLKIAFGAVQMGHLPATADEVTVGSADMLRLSEKKHVYLLGTNADEFPGAPGDEGFLTLADRELLKSLGFDTDPDRDIRGGRELFFFARAFAAAKQSVTLLYTERNASFAPVAPSPLIRHLKECSDGVLVPVDIATLPLSLRCGTVHMALGALRELSPSEAATVKLALCRAGYAEAVRVAEMDPVNGTLYLSREAAGELYGERISLTQSRIDQYLNCPLNYFCQYNLSLDAEEPARFDHRNIGTYVHAVLEHVFRALHAQNKRLSELSDREKADYILEGSKYGLAALGNSETDPRGQRLLTRLCRATEAIVDTLGEEFSGCLYEPTFFELSMGSEEVGHPAPPMFSLRDNTKVYVYGTLDRADVYRTDGKVYVRVVDYKTGTKAFSPSDLEQARNLQMFLYLKSICESKDPAFLEALGAKPGDEILPGGVIYVHTGLSAGSINGPGEDGYAALKKESRRQGMILDDGASIAAMHPDFLPVQFCKDGSPNARSADKLYSLEGWQALCALLERGVCDTAEQMKSGDVGAAPARKKEERFICENCPYKAVCRNT